MANPKEFMISLFSKMGYKTEGFEAMPKYHLIPIYNLFKTGIIPENPQPFLSHFLAIYCFFNNHPDLEKYFLTEIQNKCGSCIMEYAKFLENNPRAEFYYLESIKLGNDIALSYYARYLDHKGDPKCEQYFLESINKRRKFALSNLGYYMEKQNNPEFKKYYLTAIENGCPAGMTRYGEYLLQNGNPDKGRQLLKQAMALGYEPAIIPYGIYLNKKAKFNKMEKLYLYLIEKGNITAMILLAEYYENKKDHLLMEKYYKMVIHQIHLIKWPYQNNYIARFMKSEKFLELMAKYNWKGLIELLDKGNFEISEKILEIILSLNPEELNHVHTGIKVAHNILKQKIDLIDLHIKYSMTGTGFEEARVDFFKQIKEN